MSSAISATCDWIADKLSDLASSVVVSTYPHTYEGQAIPKILICPLKSEPLKSNACEQRWEHRIEVVYIMQNSLRHSDLTGIDTSSEIIDRIIGGDYIGDRIAWR